MKNILVSFWSPFHGQTCTTSNAVAVGTYISITHKLKILLMNNLIHKSNMESAFLLNDDDDTAIFDDSGIDSLMKLAFSSKLSPENISDYSKILIPNRLELLIGTSKTRQNDLNKLSDVIKYIATCAKETYDIIICDTNASLHGDLSIKMLDISDIVIINLNQNIEVLKSYFHKIEWHPV